MTSIRYSAGVCSLTIFLFLAFSYSVAAACGTITYFEKDGPGEFIEVTTPIEECANPFGADTPVPFEVGFAVNQQEVTESTVVVIDGEELVDISYAISRGGNFAFTPFSLFKQEEGSYMQIIYSETLLSPGEYTAVFVYEEPPLFNHLEPTWKRWLKNIFLPQTAHAFSGAIGSFQTVTISFTIEHKVPQPDGASSVLFLPGIQASRLYTDGALGTENKLWVPNRNEDVRKLAMTETGASINDIYTEDVLDEIAQLGNVYKSFLVLLEDLEEDGSIKEFVPFAYDWRYDVFAVATEPVAYPKDTKKVLVEEIERLASESYTGKVTIVAHSNGGLVTKALLHEYGEGELAGLIDKVILVGVPQLGTPKAIGSLLHGLEQGTSFGIFLNPGVIRETTVNLPGAYGLLPSAKYFENDATDIITADASLLTEPVTSYGDLGVYDNFTAFLIDQKNTRNEITNISQPITLTAGLMDKTIGQQQILDTWVAPDGVEVYEVAGTGNPTIAGFHYREFRCPDNNTQCIINPYVKPVLQFTTQGDETVVLSSATAYEGDKTRFIVNLDAESAGLSNRDISHANLTESDSVQVFIESVIKYPYLTDAIRSTEFSRITLTYKVLGVHSPVSIVVTDKRGNMTGIDGDEIKEEVEGSSYIEFAGSKYVIIPADAEVEVLLEGEESGRYSLTVEELDESGEQVLVQEVLGATSTAGMQVMFSCDEETCSESMVDYDADGKTDATFDWAGNYESLVVPEVVEEVVEERNSGQSSATRVREASVPTGQVAGITTINQNFVEMWAVLLQIQEVLDDLELYYKQVKK